MEKYTINVQQFAAAVQHLLPLGHEPKLSEVNEIAFKLINVFEHRGVVEAAEVVALVKLRLGL